MCLQVVAAAHSQEAGKAIGLVQMFNESVGKCDPDLRRDLFSSIILTGGGSLFDGLEVAALIQNNTILHAYFKSCLVS